MSENIVRLGIKLERNKNRMRWCFLLLGIGMLSISPIVAAEGSSSVVPVKDKPLRQQYLLNSNWLYLEKDIPSIEAVEYEQNGWQQISLPHTWNVWDAVDPIPGYRRAGSWYKKVVEIPHIQSPVRFVLSFEGVNITSVVYVNGQKAGGHVGGYLAFDVDITPYIRLGETNTIFVYVTNEYNPAIIPSQKSDFHIYGGITRNVWLKVLPLVFVKKVFIRTPHVTQGNAEVEIDLVISNTTSNEGKYVLETNVMDREGKKVLTCQQEQSIPAGESKVFLKLPSIKKPHLWSPDDPALYTLEVVLKKNQTIVDVMGDRFGCRWFEFQPHGPFYLNGKRLLLRGTHRHEDYAGYGNALPDSLQRKDMIMIKEMGANFVRLAHYPQAPEVYRACDELGLLVWDELPWCRGGVGDEEWKENTRRLLKEQIEQNYNHPSIIIWSLGNEIDWLPDYKDGDNIDSIRAMVKELNMIAHTLDPTRLTAIRKFTDGADLVDVISPSLWPGWYSGVYKDYEKAITDSRNKYERFFHAEYGGDSHVGRHVENPISGDGLQFSDGWEEDIKPQKKRTIAQSGDWSESYIVNLFDWYLHVSEQAEWFSGNAQWAFKDFPTPLRPENPIPYVNQKGLVDRAGNPKDAYYVFKSYWTKKPYFCYIESHTWTERSGPPDVKREVKVYSNCPEVELYLNGVSLGRKMRDLKQYPACGLNWQVRFENGKNVLIAKGYNGKRTVTEDSLMVQYSYQKNDIPDGVVFSTERLQNGNILITATVVDRNGRRCLDYNKRIYFSCDGVGNLLCNYGTPTRSSIIELANGRAQIEYKPAQGKAVIEVRNQDLRGEFLIINN